MDVNNFDSFKQLYWIAGLIEGEGCFYLRRRVVTAKLSATRLKITPLITVGMTDKDVIQKLAGIWNTSVMSQSKGIAKTYYTTMITGKRAIGWMMTLYPLMGSRRQEKIREIIKGWKG